MKKSTITLAAAALIAMAFTACAGSKPAVADSAATGNKRLTDTPEMELENKLNQKQRESIPWGIGVGVSTDRQMARTESIAQAQAALARNAQIMVTGLLDDYAKNVNGEAKRIAEDKINNFVDTQIRGSYIFETIMEFNEQDKKYSVYTLVLLDPSRVEEAMKMAMEEQEELRLHIDSDIFDEKMEQRKAEYRGLKR